MLGYEMMEVQRRGKYTITPCSSTTFKYVLLRRNSMIYYADTAS